MSSAASRGQFVWHELITTDTTGASDFYPRIAGWKTQPWQVDNSYTLLVGDGGPLGGVMSLSRETPASSHWMPYIGTTDVAATVAAARARGATVRTDTTELPNGGRYAILQDPHGAAFAVHAAGGEQAQGAQEQRDFSWHELSTTDLDAALSFYCELFGWDAAERHDMGEMGFYQLFARNGQNIGGMYVTPPGMSPHWLSYVRVKNVDAATDAAKAAGGRIVNGPMEVPGGDWIAQIIDPQGAAFAIHEVKSIAKPARPARVAKAASMERKATSTQQAAASAKAAAARNAKPAKAAASSRRAKAAKPARAKAPARSGGKAKAKARRALVRARPAKSRKPSKKQASARATASAGGSAKTKRAATRRASAARRSTSARKVARRSARRVVRAKRRR
jgi:predicted enzyme related to lactoylglutathione lyase